MAKGYWKRPITLRLTAYQRKVLSEIVDGALDAGACKGGLTKLESNALSSIFMRLIGAKESAEAVTSDPPQPLSNRDLLECARQAIEYSIEMGCGDPGGVLLQTLNKLDSSLALSRQNHSPQEKSND